MHFEVDRNEWRRCRTVESAPPDDLADGQVLLHVDEFAFTANNISYAVSGDMLDYWGFFPTEAPWGRIPVMGFGSVVRSTHPGVDEGGRYFGFYPMASHLTVDASPNQVGFVDQAAHRENHAPAYRGYELADAALTGDTGHRHLLLRGLFMTSFLVDDFLADNDFFGATSTIVTSASSKTSIALAHRLQVRGDGASVGLTSEGNRSFVEGLGLYDSVLTYDEIESLDGTEPAVVVDMAGNADVLGRIHRLFGDSLGHSCRVGATHWDELGGVDDLPGPTPTFFFAPAQIQKRTKEWGREKFQNLMGAALDEFVADSTQWMAVDVSHGPTEIERVYQDTLEGRTAPDRGQILSMGPAAP